MISAGHLPLQTFSERQNEILTFAKPIGRVGVDELASRFAVTPQTIRRDLNELCERNFMMRISRRRCDLLVD